MKGLPTEIGLGRKTTSDTAERLSGWWDQDIRQKLFLIRNKWEKLYGEVQLAVFEVHHDPKVGKGLWEWIST